MAQLVRTVESEIVPRLVMARGAYTRSSSAAADDSRIDEEETRELTRLLLNYEVEVASAFVDAVRARGVSVQDICLHLLAPAARRLGTLWEQDACDFMQVTVGLCHLHQILHSLHMAHAPPDDEAIAEPRRKALLVSAPGEQHTFGLIMVGQAFRLNGWEVSHEFPGSAADLISLVTDTWFATVGISVGSESRLSIVADTIRDLRRASRNQQVLVLVGGPMLLLRPELAREVGADASAEDGQQAAAIADASLQRLSRS